MADQKYGRNNMRITMEDGDIVIRVEAKGVAKNTDGSPKLAGTPNPTKDNPDKKRAVNLVGTSSGFQVVDGLKVSANITMD